MVVLAVNLLNHTFALSIPWTRMFCGGKTGLCVVETPAYVLRGDIEGDHEPSSDFYLC